MPIWPTKGIKGSSVSLMLRDKTLYYAHLSKNKTPITGECPWPEGLASSPLLAAIQQATDIQYIVPPESVRIIHLDKPDGLRGKNLVDYARIELLSYIDTPLDEIIPTLLNTPSVSSHYVTTQVVFSDTIKSQINQLQDHGITINRITLPDGGFTATHSNDNNLSRKIILVLDPKSPRFVSCDQGQLENIHPLPKASIPTEQGLCPTLSASIEQWINRHCANNPEPHIAVLGSSKEDTNRWIKHLSTKRPLTTGSYEPYHSDSEGSSDFTHQWVRLAAQHHKEKHYLAFDLCWAKGKRRMRQWALWPSYALLGLTALIISLNAGNGHHAISKLEGNISKLTENNQAIRESFANQKNALLGSYKPNLNQDNQVVLSGLRMLSSRHFPGLWIDTLVINKNTIELIGTTTKLPLFDQYNAWLKTEKSVKHLTLNALTPKDKDSENKQLTFALKRLNGTIRSHTRQMLTLQGRQLESKKKALASLESQRNRLLLQEAKNSKKIFTFDLTLTLK